MKDVIVFVSKPNVFLVKRDLTPNSISIAIEGHKPDEFRLTDHLDQNTHISYFVAFNPKLWQPTIADIQLAIATLNPEGIQRHF